MRNDAIDYYNTRENRVTEIQLPIFARSPSSATNGFILQNRLYDIQFAALLGKKKGKLYCIVQ